MMKVNVTDIGGEVVKDNVFHKVHNNSDVGLEFICIFDGRRNH